MKELLEFFLKRLIPHASPLASLVLIHQANLRRVPCCSSVIGRRIYGIPPSDLEFEGMSAMYSSSALVHCARSIVAYSLGNPECRRSLPGDDLDYDTGQPLDVVTNGIFGRLLEPHCG